MKEGGINARKAGQMWGLSMKKSTLTRVKLNRRVTFNRRIRGPFARFFFFFFFFNVFVFVFFLTKNEEKKNDLRIG